ncbi:MAG: DUF402 domain-containing protein [Chloroflexota bacterium]
MFSEHWPTTEDGAPVRIVKVSPEGVEVTEYPATVVASRGAGPWICVEARWTFRRIDVDGLVFEPGDTLLEWFSREHWYNVFAVYSPEGRYRGAYANVTYPVRHDAASTPPTLAWHDLYLDVILLPDGREILRDEDELAESGLAERDPELHANILAGCEALRAHLRSGEAPFAELPGPDESGNTNRT